MAANNAVRSRKRTAGICSRVARPPADRPALRQRSRLPGVLVSGRAKAFCRRRSDGPQAMQGRRWRRLLPPGGGTAAGARIEAGRATRARAAAKRLRQEARRRLRGGRGLARADGPDGLIGDDRFHHLLLAQAGQAATHLGLQNLLGLARFALGDPPGAAADYERALALGHPEDPNLRAALRPPGSWSRP